MEDESSKLSVKTEPLDQTRGQTPVEEAGESQKDGPMLSDQADQVSGHPSLGACSLGNSVEDWEEEFTEDKTQPVDRRLLTPTFMRWDENREGSSIESASSKVAPYNRGSPSSSNPSEYLQSSSGGQTYRDSPGSYNKSQTTNESAYSQKIDNPAHVAYWAEQKHQLPLPLLNLLEEETLEILTKTLQSYRKGIGKDHKLTQQLQMQVEKLSKNLKKRRLPTH
ncbi:cation channel sperm-associated protein subunit zeta [Gracilinanus agilis]|uniref:cation channel sperm-associated protein subunit zeta n=1 Tax=Gracilinanus agilis TaxID=191870 RepID=UPI001CFC6805|nr:cation channel sperm-associated protein subunit zeta [Gracilinanus agilis]